MWMLPKDSTAPDLTQGPQKVTNLISMRKGKTNNLEKQVELDVTTAAEVGVSALEEW